MASIQLRILSGREALRRSLIHTGLPVFIMLTMVACAFGFFFYRFESGINAWFIAGMTATVLFFSYMAAVLVYLDDRFEGNTFCCIACGSLWNKAEMVILTKSKNPCKSCCDCWDIRRDL